MTATAEDQLLFAGPAALAARVRAGELTARELVELSLRRIEQLNPRLNAFRTTMPEEALAAADGLKGTQGPLLGVPVAVKDDLPVAGQSTTFGSRTYGPPHEHDSVAVARLRKAGAIPVGITNVPELMIFPWTATLANGITRNPWDTSRTPGGSSGGSAAAVAAGLVAAATGSDGGGSIRIPAACCGLVGMKPTRGRVPADEGWLDLSVFGALARTTVDSALMLDVMAGSPDGRYLAAATAAKPGRLRVAISRKVPPGLIASLSKDQRGAFESTASLLSDLGHDVVERHPAYGLSALTFTQTWIRAIYEDFVRMPDPSLAERSTRQMAAAGRALVSKRRRDKLLSDRPALTARILRLWDEVDVLLTPGLARTAIAAEGGFDRPAPVAFDRAARFTPWTPLFNVTGQPGIAIPAGVGEDGLPLSVQLVGRPGDEALLYSLAAQIEAARPWADRRPPGD
jgi:amidase